MRLSNHKRLNCFERGKLKRGLSDLSTIEARTASNWLIKRVRYSVHAPRCVLGVSLTLEEGERNSYMYTVEPLNNGHIGTDHFVHYREVVLFQRQKCIATI